MPKKYKNMTRDQLLSATDMTELDVSKARSCPEGISVVVVTTENAPSRKITPRILIEAVRRGWPVVTYDWMASCINKNSLQSFDNFSIDSSQLLMRVKPNSGVSTIPDRHLGPSLLPPFVYIT